MSTREIVHATAPWDVLTVKPACTAAIRAKNELLYKVQEKI